MTDLTTAGIPLIGSPSAGPSSTMGPAVPSVEPLNPQEPSSYADIIRRKDAADAETWNLTMRAAIGTDPAVAAEADKLARKLNQPLLKLQDDPQFLRAVSVMKRMTDDKIASTNPVLYKSFQGLEFARKAWDDYEHLSSYERWGNAFNKGMLVSERGRVASDLAMAGDNLKGEPAKNIADARRRFVEIEQEMAKLGPTTGFIGNAVEIFGQLGSQLPRAFATGLATGAVTGAAGLVAPPAAPLTFAAGFKAGFVGQLAVDVMRTEGGNAYADMVAANYDPERAFKASLGIGLVNAVLELSGGAIASRAIRTEIAQRVTQQAVREVARDIPGGFVSGFLREYGKGIAAEVTTETLQEMANIIGEAAAAKGGERDLSPDGIASRLWEVASKTVQGMAVLGVPGGLTGGMRAKVAQDAAKAEQERLREGQAIGAASKLNQRDSEAAAGMVREVLNQGGIREAHVDAATLRDVLAKVDAEATAAGKLQKSALDILEGIVPGVAEQLQQALEVGGDVSVPLGDFVTRIQAEMPEFAAAIGPNVRLDPDSPTLDTADKAQAEKQADAADTGTEEQAAFYAALKKVEVEATAQIIETGGAQLAPEQVRTVAKVYAAAIETVAREERIDPAEAVKRYGATFEKAGAEQQGDVLSQFVGVQAKGVNKTTMRKAFGMLQEGASSDAIYAETGWLVSPQGSLRIELSDDAATLKVTQDGLLGDVLNHPALFKAYPKLKEIPVKFGKVGEGVAGVYYGSKTILQWTPSTASIFISGEISDSMKLRTLLHEVQHAIQDIEGDFSSGTKAQIASASEVEARNVEKRRKMTAEERAANSPEGTEDVPRSKVLTKNQESMMSAAEVAAAEKEAVTARTSIIEARKQANDILRQPGRDVLSQPLKTDTPEFKAWFGESKAVYDNVPRLVYRGATSAKWLDADGEFYFSSSPDVAASYASTSDVDGNDAGGGGVFPAYLSIENPLVVDAGGGAYNKVPVDPLLAKKLESSGFEFTGLEWSVAALSKAAKTAGFDGLIVKNVLDADVQDGGGVSSDVYVVFKRKHIKSVNNRGTWSRTDQNILHQPGLGYFDPKRLAVMFTDGTDVSTVLHELTHWFVEVVERLDRQGSAYGKAQFDVLLARWGKTREQWAAMDFKAREPMLEDISYNAEEYFATGEAPSEELRGVFGKLRTFMVGLYRNVRAIYLGTMGRELPAMTPELRGFFDRMLAADSAIEAENALRAGAARLSDAAAKAIGADAETLAEIRSLEQQATDEAKARLTAEAVRGARFFQAGRRNAEKDTRKKLAQAKAKIRKEVEDSLATNPVQAAFQYFRDGLVDLIDGTREFDPAAKKLDSASLRAFLGLPPVKGGEKAPSLVARIRELGGINPEGYPGDLRGEHRIVGVFRKEGGESFERIAQVLAAEGYGGEVYDGALAESVDSSWLVDAIKDAAQGVTLYPSEFVSDSTRMQAEYEAWAKSKSPEADEDVRARRRQQNEGERLYLRLARRRLVQKDGFSDLDAGAKMFGFESAEEMLNGLANAPLREEAIRAETNRRLEAEEPLANPDNFKRAVEKALHGKTATRLLRTILRAMMRGTRKIAGNPHDRAEADQLVSELDAQAREAARIALLRAPIGRINVRAFAQAELRAAKSRDRALTKGDVAAARQAHQQLMVQHYLTIGAAKVEREVQRALVTIDKRYGKSKDQIIEEKRNYDIVNAGRFILGKFGLFPEQATEAARTYLATLRELDPEGWETLDIRVKLATENAKPWRSVSLDDFRVLMATADGMWSESHRSEQMRIAGQLVAMQPLREEMEGQMVDLFGGGTEAGLKLGQEVMPLSDWSWGSFEAVVSRLEAWTKKMDGGKLGGPWQRNVYRPLKAAAVAKELEMADHQKWWAEHLAKFENSATRPLTGKEIDLKRFFPASSHAKFENIAQVIGALFHMGTESNFRNFILGHGFGDMVNGQLVTRWGDALQYLANNGDLTKKDFDLVAEAVAYINDNFRDRLFTTTREVWCFYPEAVEAMPFDAPFGKYPGGYFPSKVDKRYSNVGERQQFKGIEQGRDEFMRANHNVSRGVVTSRVKFSVEKRVTDLNLVTEHIDTVLSIIHVQPALSDVARLFSGRNNTMAATLQQTQPYAKRGIILPALARMARDSIVAQTDGRISAIATNLKQMASLFFLGLNPKNAAQQFTGLANAIGELGNGPVWASFWTTWSNPSKAFRGIEGMSDAMRNRWSDAMQLASNDIKQILSPSTLGKARAETAKAAFFMQRYAQKMVDAIVWSAAFEKAKGNGIEDAEAVQQADQVVRLTQGEKTPLDVPVILSGDAVKQLFTQFMDYPNTVLNQNLAAPAGRRWATLTWTLLVPTLASSAIGLMLAFGQIGKGDRDDDDYNKRLAKHLIGDQIRGAFGLVPIAGSFIGSMLNNLYGFTNDPGGLRNQPFAGWSVVDLVSRVGGGDAKFSDLLAGVAMGARLPARPAVNVARYQERVEAGREEQGGLIDYLRVLLSGR